MQPDTPTDSARDEARGKRAELAAAVTNGVCGGVCAVRLGGDSPCLVYANDGFFRMLGYTREQFACERPEGLVGVIHAEDLPEALKKTSAATESGEPFQLQLRAMKRDGGVIWVFASGIRRELQGERALVLAMIDVSAQKESESVLRASVEQYRAAAAIGGRRIARYDIKNDVYTHNDESLLSFGFGTSIRSAVRTFVEAGLVLPEVMEDYRRFWDRIRAGEGATLVIPLPMPNRERRWARLEASVIPDADGQPSQAVIVSTDITEQREKEAVYAKWQQSLRTKAPDSYTLLRCNLSRDTFGEPAEGTLLTQSITSDLVELDEWARVYAARHIHPDDLRKFLDFLSADALLASYYRGRRSEALEYREQRPGGDVRWLSLTVEMVERPDSSDVEAFLMFEDIDEGKRAAMRVKRLAETDPLTGVLNRAAFVRQVNQLIADGAPSRHAMLMLDIDSFKQLNDALGHAAGDQALIEVTGYLRSILRQGDLLGRLGGDEFVVFLRDIPYDAAIEKKAKQICSLLRKAYSPEARISASVGIAICPKDGEDFDALYRHADAALYSVKNGGRDNFLFYDDGMTPPEARLGAEQYDEQGEPMERFSFNTKKRRMLIVDDDEGTRKMLAKFFSDEYNIESAIDGTTALVRLRHYGEGIAVVLLDLAMPIMDGFAVLERMQMNADTRGVPVIILSEQDERSVLLKAVQRGASDVVTKPIDLDLLRLRVNAAINRADRERERAQNSYRMLQSNEELKYRTVLDSTGTVVVEYDWINSAFVYDSSISKHIAGNYDGRSLWRVLLSDMVADVMDVKAMQELVHAIANDRERAEATMTISLKTPQGRKHPFRMNVYKIADEFQLTDKVILTFNDVSDGDDDKRSS